MNEKIVSLRGDAIVGDPPHQVMDEIENALREAQRGEIAAIGWIKVRPNGEVGVGYRGQRGMRHNHLIAAGCFYLAHDIAAQGEVE